MKIKKARRVPMIPLSSTSDIGFLLLIFIMLVALINYRQEIKIEYSEAISPQNVNEIKNLEIWVNQSGEVYHNGKIMDYPGVENLILSSISKHPDIRIHILADKNTPYKYINNIVEILKLIQHRTVSFVVKEAKS